MHVIILGFALKCWYCEAPDSSEAWKNPASCLMKFKAADVKLENGFTSRDCTNGQSCASQNMSKCIRYKTDF